jgi:hypothetical protein
LKGNRVVKGDALVFWLELELSLEPREGEHLVGSLGKVICLAVQPRGKVWLELAVDQSLNDMTIMNR